MPRGTDGLTSPPHLPDRVFISHAYDDVQSRNLLLRSLPDHVIPEVFPRQHPDPKEAVSDDVVVRIRACGALVFLSGGRSEESVWVNFERDYALRAGLDVFQFDPSEEILRSYGGSPVPLAIELLVGEDSEDIVDRLLDWMRRERDFEFDESPTRARMKEIPDLVAKLIHRDRAPVWFLDDHIHGLASFALDVPTEMLCYAYNRRLSGNERRRDPSEFEYYADWLLRHSTYVRVSAEWEPTTSGDPEERAVIADVAPIDTHFTSDHAIDIVPTSNGTNVDWNGVDDMIVQLTLKLKQSHRPFFLNRDHGGS